MAQVGIKENKKERGVNPRGYQHEKKGLGALMGTKEIY